MGSGGRERAADAPPPPGRREALSPEGARAVSHDLPARRWLAGGWAPDCFSGRRNREHADGDVEVLRRDQGVVGRHLAGRELHTAADGVLRPWRAGEDLGDGVNSLWCRPRPGVPWAVQIMFAEAAGGHRRYRRHPAIGLPLDRIGPRTAAGIPFLAPEVQLLYKSRAPRPKDGADFALALPLRSPERRDRPAAALGAAHPGHRRLARL